MRALPNLSGQISGPRIKPKSLGSIYVSADPYYDPDFWINGYSTSRIIGVSSQVQLRFDVSVEWTDTNGSYAYYKVTNNQETYSPDTSPGTYGFTEIVDKGVITINNGQYLSVSLDSRQIGQGGDYAEFTLGSSINGTLVSGGNIATLSFEVLTL